MSHKHFVLLTAALCVFSGITPADASLLSSGSNLAAPASTIAVPFDDVNGQWLVQLDLLHDPTAGVMIKNFDAPQGTQPGTMWPVWEEFTLDPSSAVLEDWHEEIITLGWEWEFDPNALITLNGEPYPSNGGATETQIWAEFEGIPAVGPNGLANVFDVHKFLVYRGIDFNDDGQLDPWLGGPVTVVEYPTPEPGTMALLMFGVAGVSALTRRRR